jgi:hypothetical protein
MNTKYNNITYENYPKAINYINDSEDYDSRLKELAGI